MSRVKTSERKQSHLQLERCRNGGLYPEIPHDAKLKSKISKSKIGAQRLLHLQILEYDELKMLPDENVLDMRDLQVARSKSFGAPYSHPLKPPIAPSAPSAPFKKRRAPYGAFRDAAFADLIGVDNGFICSLLKYRYRKTPAVQDMQLKDITFLIWHCQNNWDWTLAAPWPKTPPEQVEMIGTIIRDLGHAVTLGY